LFFTPVADPVVGLLVVAILIGVAIGYIVYVVGYADLAASIDGVSFIILYGVFLLLLLIASKRSLTKRQGGSK
jgi:hypothetical protein